ncbi:hypothetical protein PpBr36_01831 [Pyricularia pennisetigena]|uniref:hypothetical protein n=1 Tax=Pyricularia pennisetigena TaxID=1578925 RepID=UPI00114FA099|nr:hypothetical protein PpBr36_01831 [Pyricularia pennisetigena]TLS28072.1 hypothetical protein PpBr36_01831 [Pyricularia pennisetigena]
MKLTQLAPIAARLFGTCLAAAAAALSDPTTSITISIPASPQLPNPYTLPPSTRATLTSSGPGKQLHAPLSAANTFVFANVTAGSYLLDVHCSTHAFAPLRVDAAASDQNRKLAVAAWETFRGNDWGNKGEPARRVDVGAGVPAFEVKVLGRKDYFVERSTFSVFSILKSPMILLALVSMGIFLGMPYLIENMDPEVRAEFEARQKSSPMNAMLGGGGGKDASPLANFDMAAFLAGSGSGNAGGGSSSTKREEASPAPPSGGKKGNGGRR